MKLTLLLLLSIATLLLFLWWLVRIMEPRLTFYPLEGVTAEPADLGIAHQALEIPTSDGVLLRAWYLPHSQSRAEILFFHGNAGNLSTWLDFLAALYAQGYSVAAVDYRGYGQSTGTPDEEGILEDSRAFVDFFYSRLYDSDLPVVYFGRSLGGVTSAYAASKREPDGLVLEATFPSKRSLLRHYPFFRALAIFSRYQLATASYLEDVDCPTLVIHGDEDRIIPVEEGRKLASKLNGSENFLLVPGAGHNDLHRVGGSDYWNAISGFIEGLRDGANSDQ